LVINIKPYSLDLCNQIVLSLVSLLNLINKSRLESEITNSDSNRLTASLN